MRLPLTLTVAFLLGACGSESDDATSPAVVDPFGSGFRPGNWIPFACDDCEDGGLALRATVCDGSDELVFPNVPGVQAITGAVLLRDWAVVSVPGNDGYTLLWQSYGDAAWAVLDLGDAPTGPVQVASPRLTGHPPASPLYGRFIYVRSGSRDLTPDVVSFFDLGPTHGGADYMIWPDSSFMVESVGPEYVVYQRTSPTEDSMEAYTPNSNNDYVYGNRPPPVDMSADATSEVLTTLTQDERLIRITVDDTVLVSNEGVPGWTAIFETDFGDLAFEADGELYCRNPAGVELKLFQDTGVRRRLF